jgi:serine phosphatase RsbU (regulator of sigma subunit)
MRELYNKLLNNGVRDDLSFSEKNKLRVFNPSVFFVFLISAFYTVVGAVVHLPLALIDSAIGALVCVLAIWLISKRIYQFSFHFVMIFAFFYLTSFTLLFGLGPQSYLYFLFMQVAANILFDRFTVTIKYFAGALICMSFSIIYMQNHTPIYGDTPLNNYMFGVSNALFTSVLIFVGVRLFKSENLNYAEQLEHKNSIIEEKNKNITDSINYAKRIQYTLLAHSAFLKQHLPEHFILFKPKDIVSGDFYWATSVPNKNDKDLDFYLAVCDSTGHGVPGAFMSLLNSSFLNEAINEKNIKEPHAVLNHVRARLIESISQDGGKDGMDAVLVRWECTTDCVDPDSTQDHKVPGVTYSAANNHPVLIRDKQIIEFPKDKMPVGKGERTDSFNLHRIEGQPGDILYLYTDGFADQFGGPKGKKFKYRQLNELLLQLSADPLSTQKEKLNKVFENWRGELEQVDDVCIVGIKF